MPSAHFIADCCRDGNSGVSVSAQGAAAVLFMQLCRRIHFQLSSGAEPGTNPGTLTGSTTLHRCGYRLLLEIRQSLCHSWPTICHQEFVYIESVPDCTHMHLISRPPSVSKRDVLARGSNVLCLQAVSESPETSAAQSSSSSIDTQAQTSNGNCLVADCTTSDQQRGVLTPDSFIPGIPLPPGFLLIFSVVAGNHCLFRAYFTDGSLLLESSPLQNDANENSTDGRDAKVKCLFNFLFRHISLSCFIGSSTELSVFSGWVDQRREIHTSRNQL